MAFVIKDRVRETTATTGTGTVTLAGAVSGYQSFAAIGNGNTTYYCIAGQGTNEWEVGIGTYTSAGTTLSRTTVLSSSNGGSLVPFSAGTKDVFVTQPASRAVFQDDSLNASTGNNFNAASYNNGQLAGFRNKIINGNMAVAQRLPYPTTSSITAGIDNQYVVDRWIKNGSGLSPASLTMGPAIDAPASQPGLYYSFAVTVTNNITVITNPLHFCSFSQLIEGYNARALVNTDFTISFWVKSSKTGIYGLSLTNSAADRAYVVEYTVNSANTWEYKTVTVLGGLPASSGTWDWTNGNGLRLRWTLVAGTSRQTATTNSWFTPAAGYYTTASQVNFFDTIGNVFAMTGVQVELGTVATPFENRLFSTELALCQRYYEKSFPLTTAVASNAGTSAGAATATAQVNNQRFSTFVKFAVNKRTTGIVSTFAPDAGTSNWSTNTTTPTVDVPAAFNGETGFLVAGTTATTAGNDYAIHWVSQADFITNT